MRAGCAKVAIIAIVSLISVRGKCGGPSGDVSPFPKAQSCLRSLKSALHDGRIRGICKVHKICNVKFSGLREIHHFGRFRFAQARRLCHYQKGLQCWPGVQTLASERSATLCETRVYMCRTEKLTEENPL